MLNLFVDLPFRLRLRSNANLPSLANLPDLPVRIASLESKFVVVEDMAEEEGKGDIATLLLADTLGTLNQFVVQGAPGQGKSTLAQYVCQVHRIRLLDKTEELALLPEVHRNAPIYLPR